MPAINMAGYRYENDGGHPRSGLPATEEARGQRGQLRQAIDSAWSEARAERRAAKVSPPGAAADRAVEAAGNARAQQCQDLRDYFFSLISTCGRSEERR